MKIRFEGNVKTLNAVEGVWKEVKRVDGFDNYSTVESRLNLESLSGSKIAVLEDDSGEVCGYAVLKDVWDEKDGTHVFLIDTDVKREYRGKAVEDTLLKEIEDHCTSLKVLEVKNVIGCNATLKESNKIRLYSEHGYKEEIRLVEMEMILDEETVDSLKRQIKELPFEIRSPRLNEYRAVYEMIFAAMVKGTIGETEPSEEDYQGFIEKETKRLDLGTFIWDNGKIIAQVTVGIDDEKAEILELAVLPEYWRRGIGSQMMLRTMLKIYESGMRRIRFHTDAYNRYGAKTMYEKLGFRVVDESIRFRRQI